MKNSLQPRCIGQMKVQCDNGLCDRLRMIFSYLRKVQLTKSKLTVCWQPNTKCNGHFLDVFEPVDDIVFTEDSFNVDYNGWQPARGFHPEDRHPHIFIYQDLTLRKELQVEVNRLREEMGKYVAVHVRRTDKTWNAPGYPGLKKLTQDVEFFQAIDNSGCESIFLATDCMDVQHVFKERYGDRLFWAEEILPTEKLRQTSLEGAGIDLFTCIFANKFVGGKLTGFSRFIEQYRHYKKSNFTFL